MGSLTILFAVIGFFLAAYFGHKSRSGRLKSLQRRLDILNPQIDYQYNRFNTKNERTTSLKFDSGEFNLVTDIQNIRIANQVLLSKISSQYQESPILFDISIQPFDKLLFDIEEFTHINQKGIILLWSYGAHSKLVIEQSTELNFLVDVISDRPQGVYFQFDSFQIDKIEDSVIIYGRFDDGKKFTVTIDYKQYELKVIASLESIKNASNFKEISDLDNVHELLH